MWQRIQTLYLFIAILINSLLFTLSYAQLTSQALAYQLGLLGVEDSEATLAMFPSSFGILICAFSIFISVIIILMFKKRQLQMKLAKLNLLLQVGLVVFMFLIVDSLAIELQLGENYSIEYGVAAYLSIVPMLLIYLAIKAIKKDEALVRSADRIR